MYRIVSFLVMRNDSSFFEEKIKLFTKLREHFPVSLDTISLEKFTIVLAYYGKLESLLIKNQNVLSFYLGQPCEDLFDESVFKDRFLRVCVGENNVIFENDWLGSIPVFYNSDDQIVSNLPLLTLTDKSIHFEGLNNYFEFGYSVFEQTPFEKVKFMRYYSKLLLYEDGIDISYKDDLVSLELLDTEIDEKKVLKMIEKYIRQYEDFYKGDIIIPTSGGYDSRLLNYLIKDKSRIRSFTYGISKNQNESFEVVKAKKIADILDTKWKQIELEEFHKYICEWHLIYGFSTHLHGMYHIEFYRKMIEKNIFTSNFSFISGIIGDAWAGSVNIPKIESVDDLNNLSYSHGMKLNLKHINFNGGNELKNSYLSQKSENLSRETYRIIESMRLKIILLSYLMNIPEFLGLNPWTPFLNFDIATSMLRIPESRRENRLWQKDFFSNVGLDLENINLSSVRTNDLNYEISKNTLFEPIKIELMKDFVNSNYIKEINSHLQNCSKKDDFKRWILNKKYIGFCLKKIGLKNDYLQHLFAYYVIKAVEMGLENEY